MSEEDLDAPTAFTKMVGERIRAIRKQRRWSLGELEAQSNNEFKASVVGAYERGERAISVPRLEGLARLLGVPVDQLLPTSTERVSDSRSSSAPVKLRIDVAKLSTFEGAEFKMLERYLRMLQVKRQDFNGKVITVRSDDWRAIAVMLDCEVDQVGERLGELDLLFVPPAAQ
jgi:transcriptional regulator with XRE-family HTH domain